MTQNKDVKIRLMFWLLSFTVLIVAPVSAQHGAPNGDWPYWGGDAGSTRYSALDQINKNNVQKLEIAWRWYSANYGPIPEFYFRATPLEVGGVIYTVAGERRAAVAIDAGTGETLWMWRMKNNPRWEKSPRRFSGRGLAYSEVDGEGRIIVVTPGYYMVMLDAATGRPVDGFGKNGIIDLQEGLGFKVDPVNGIDPKYGLITHGSPPIVVNDIIVVGNAHGRGYYPKQKENIPGHIRGYDIKTGKQRWIFHVIPKPGEYGHDTWEGDSWTYTGNISSWATLSADPELNIVYIPTDCPTGDYYGGHRHGDNLYGTALVALNVKTGKRIWHQQFVKHDIWNYDTPTAPNLLDIRVKRKKIKAIVQATKQGWAYVFDRKTGKPVWPMEERKVPASDVPGEKTSPTQLYPTWPLPFELQEVTVDELIDFTPELRAQAVELASKYRMGPIFTPPSLAEDPEDGTQGTFVMPGANGGANIPGGAVVDPETGIFYVASEKRHSVIRLVNDPEKSKMNYISLGPGGIRGPQGLQLLKPPYSRIVAIDMNTGKHLWNIPNGNTPKSLSEHPALEGVDLPQTGNMAHAGLVITKTLLFSGEGRGGDPWFRAYDKKTGEVVAEIELPAQTNHPPMTYMHNGKQYIVMPVAAPGHPAELVALALPDEDEEELEW
ncbi:MAG: PQQ-binding-like beta-propeller repeat protein [Candidatus Marinimicrobia bacterium]|jgi:quinoprotein glucose dehydrogenase|nr:PQQ-binding-like beta-propeller repeat protein [Candidatus Neomarinimicrobiota bacterium]MDP7436483.1 PQQ-binding-like beta-propeller repeat protein [Candidatus Neomarinimicrobiota bacterium]MDP7716703.1 PQQ-binding-like beta-propeller repeat protein [Candidatus Neomarinimicrobiota bacterium]